MIILINKYTNPLPVFFGMILMLLMALPSCHKVSDEIDPDDLRQYITDLSSGSYKGRESGSLDSRRAAFFLAENYRRAALYPAFAPNQKKLQQQVDAKNEKNTKAGNSKKHAQTYTNAINKDTDPILAKSNLRNYLQPFSFKAGLEVKNKNYFYLETADHQTFKQNVKPLPFSNPGNVSGPLVFGSFCLQDLENNWNDFENFNPEGKIVLCLRHGPGGADNQRFKKSISFQSKWNTLAKLGAAGVIFLGREGFDLPNPHNFMPSTKNGPIAILAHHTPLFDQFPVLAAEYKNVLAEKKSKFIGQTLGNILLHTDYKIPARIAYNVGAYLKKPQVGERLLVIGAHLDHLGYGFFSSMGTPGLMHYGADDNASGTAGVLELAMYFKKHSDKIAKNSNILFLNFDAEERGLIGSRFYLDSDYFSKPELMINLDMIGRLRKTRGLSIQGCYTADIRWNQIFSRAFARNLGGDSFHALQSNSTKNECNDIVGQNGMNLRYVKGGNGPSDHSGFYAKDVAIAFFFTGSHKQYHTQNDRAELINYDGLANITRMIRDVVESWSHLTTPLEFKKTTDVAQRSDFDFKLRLGIVPGDYSGGNEGLEVYDVKEDAPVYKTGLKKGDIIIKLGEQKIGNINDLMDFLSNASSKRKYLLEFKRDGKIHSVQTELMNN